MSESDLLCDLLQELNDFRNSVDFYCLQRGYQPTDIENMLLDLEQKLREVEEEMSLK